MRTVIITLLVLVSITCLGQGTSVRSSNGTATNLTMNGTLTFQNGSFIQDINGNKTIDPVNRFLIDHTGLIDVISWDVQQMVDSAGVASVYWGARDLFGSSGTVTVNWNLDQLFDTTTALSLNWSTRQAIQSDGVTEGFHWASGFQSINVVNGTVGNVSVGSSATNGINFPSGSGTAVSVNGTNELFVGVLGIGVGTNNVSPTNALAVTTPREMNSLQLNTNGDLILAHGENLMFKMTNSPVITTGIITNSVLGAGTGSRVIPANYTTLGSSIFVKAWGYISNTTTLTRSNWLVIDGTVMLIGTASQANSSQPTFYDPNGIQLTIMKAGVSGTINVILANSTFNVATIFSKTNSYPWDTTAAHTIDVVEAYSSIGNFTFWNTAEIWIVNPP